MGAYIISTYIPDAQCSASQIDEPQAQRETSSRKQGGKLLKKIPSIDLWLSFVCNAHSNLLYP